MSNPTPPAPAIPPPTPTPPPPPGRDTIAGYRLLQPIGEGGMGEVFEAEQLEPVRRRVALKIIKRGMDSADVVARFETERQALAMMDHPGIAKVYDAGTTDQGRPFFAMEYVAGVPITEHCDRHRLDVNGRLALFVRVCEAVQHAHHKAVIHRDLKPSNVLVTHVDDRTLPKIIDFGVAKAVSHRLTERTMFTELGQMIGTPEYMSPEQAEMTGQNIDTRSDVYSLGVLLYEILVGALPFDPRALRRAGFDEIRRRIREEEPPRPSTRLSKLGATSMTSAQNRRTSFHKLTSELRGDLDWITMKALEKDRTRRYGSPADLAADLSRHLRHEPVLAGPPGSFYRVSKFVRRHRLGVGVAAGGITLLAAFAVETALQNDVIAAERDRARQEALKASSVNDFLQDMLAAAQPEYAKGRDLTVLEVLDIAALQLREGERPEPAVEAALHRTLGRTFRALGAFEPAAAHLQSALEFHTRAGGSAVELADARLGLALVRYDQGDYPTARELAGAALAAFVAERGPEHEDVARCRALLAQIIYNEGRFADAVAEHESVLALRRRLHGDGSTEVAQSLRTLAFALQQSGAPAKALPPAREALQIVRRVHGEVHPAVVASLLEVADVELALGDMSAAEADLRQALHTAEELHGARHPSVANCQWRLGSLLARRDDLDAAAPLLAGALEQRRELLQSPHRDLATAAASLANLRQRRGDFDGAEALFREALAMRRQLFGEVHVAVAASLDDLGTLRRRQQRWAEAEELLQQAIAMWRQCLGPDSGEEAGSTVFLALTLQDQQKYDAAETAFRAVLRIFQTRYPDGHPKVGMAINNLASLLVRKGEAATAEELFRQALAIRRKLLSRGHPELMETLGNLAFVLEKRGAFADAEPLQQEFVEMARATLPPGHANVLGAMTRLGANLVSQQRWAEAETLFLEVQRSQTDANSSPAARRRTVERLVALYEASGQAGELARWRGVLEATPAGK